MNDRRPKVSVVIPVRDDIDRLRLCLQALADQTIAASAREVIVVDNGSKKSVREELVPAAGVRILEQPEGGSYAARNTGAAVARGEILAFTDSDCIPATDWLERGLLALAQSPRALIVGRIDVFANDERSPSSVELFEQMFGFPQQRYVTQFGFGATANVMISREQFQRAGGFMEKALSGGDLEFGARISSWGWKVIYHDEVVVRHPARRDWASLRAKIQRTQTLRPIAGKRSLASDAAYFIRCCAAIWRSNLGFRNKARVQWILIRVSAGHLPHVSLVRSLTGRRSAALEPREKGVNER